MSVRECCFCWVRIAHCFSRMGVLATVFAGLAIFVKYLPHKVVALKDHQTWSELPLQSCTSSRGTQKSRLDIVWW